MNETWEDIKEYEGLYKINSIGEIKNAKTNNLIKPFNLKGYDKIALRKNKKTRNCFVHRLVAEAFIPNVGNLPFINHKDENTLNNHISNLEWCTHKYNMNYGNRNQKISNALNKQVIQKTMDGKTMKTYPSAKRAQIETGIFANSISRCVNKKQKTAGGFLWESGADK